MRPHHKLSGNADTPSFTTRKTLHITMPTNQFVCIITQRHRMDSILNHILLLAEETRKLEQCWVIQKLSDSEWSNQCGFPLNKSLGVENKYLKISNLAKRKIIKFSQMYSKPNLPTKKITFRKVQHIICI